MDILFQLPFFFENKVLFKLSSFEFMYSYIFVILMFALLAYKRKLVIPQSLLYLWGLLLIMNFYGLINNTASIKEVTKQLLGIIIFSSTIFSFIAYKKNNIIQLVKLYLNSAFILSIIGLIQVLLGFFLPALRVPFLSMEVIDPIIFNIIRISSLFREPAHFAFFLSPAIYIIADHIINKNNFFLSWQRSIIILMAFLFTFSSSGFIVFFVVPFFFLRKKQIVISLFLLIGFISLLKDIELFKLRIDDSMQIAQGIKTISQVNLSTYALVSNFEVASINLSQNPILGTGFGSHEKQYMIQFAEQTDWPMILNASDAGSLFLRILSELGLLGMGVFLYFIFKCKINKDNINEYYTINNMCLMIFVMAFIRNGHYFNYTLWVFIAIYYNSYKLSKIELKS